MFRSRARRGFQAGRKRIREKADGGATRARWAPVRHRCSLHQRGRNVVSCEPIETAIPKIDPSAEIRPHRRVFNGGPATESGPGETKRGLTTGFTHSHHVPIAFPASPSSSFSSLWQQFFFDVSSRFLSIPRVSVC